MSIIRYLSYKIEAGQIMVEVMLAISITIISLIGFFGLTNQAFNVTRIVADQYTGTYLAAEGIEIVKYLVEKNYAANRTFHTELFAGGIPNNNSATTYEADFDTATLITPPTNTFLRRNINTGFYSYGDGEQTPFKRTITIEKLNGGDAMRVTSHVTWTTGKKAFETSVSDTFYYWWKDSVQ